jgi:inner membrane protein
MFEVLRQLRVHPLQYALVGVALTVFFVLLLSLSEYIGFNKAYVLAGLACVGQITFYVSHILHSMKRGVGFGLALATLYAVLFGLLQSEDVSLLLGSVGLFVVVSAVMFATRRLNWYALTDGLGGDKV